MRRLLVIGRHIFVRTAALLSAFTLAGAVIARFGDASLAAHQIAFQLWIFLAFVLDAIAIAGQVLVGRGLGAGDTERAYAASVRMIWLSVYAGIVSRGDARARRRAPVRLHERRAVIEKAQAIWLLFALMQPLNGAVFALDGILIGAGDGRYLMWSMVAAFAVCAVGWLAALAFDWGIVGVWASLVVLICVRLGLMLWRFQGRRWLVTGWAERAPRPHAARVSQYRFSPAYDCQNGIARSYASASSGGEVRLAGGDELLLARALLDARRPRVEPLAELGEMAARRRRRGRSG